MKDKRFLELIEAGRWDELESYWLERMQSGEYEFEDFLEVAKLLGRHREKARAGVLMRLLAEHLREKQRWALRLRVLKEILRHTPDPKKLADLREDLKDALQQVFPNRPSFPQFLKHFQYEDQRSPEDLAGAADGIELWLRHDVGMLFYQRGYGPGRVTEINPRLGVIRVDFEKKKDVTMEPGDGELIPLEPGHILHDKMEALEKFRSDAEASPQEALGRLLREFGRAMTVGEIKDCFAGGLAGDWTRWWNAAKKHTQIVVSGKGAQAEYSWSDSASAAEEAVRKEFDSSSVRARISIAKQHVSRSSMLAQHFLATLMKDLHGAHERKDPAVVLDLLELLAKWPGQVPDSGITFEQIVREFEPRILLSAVDNVALRTRILAAYPELKPENWASIYAEWFTREDNPKLLASMLESLQKQEPATAEALLNKVFGSLHAFPAAFVWIIEQGAREGLDIDADPIGQRIEGKFLLAVIEAIDSSEFSPYRNRIKKAIESGLLMNIVNEAMDPDVAHKALEQLEHTRYLEDYRRDRWRNFIRSRIPETKKKDDIIFSTKDAMERKRAELEHLIKVELPINRKAVGEAAAHGDLKENHEYKAARERQEYLINRVEQLQAEMIRVRVLEPGTADCSEVRPGTRVELTQPEKSMSLTLLGPWDSNPKDGFYSYQSPVGILLLGKQRGEKILWNDETWTIEKIEPWS